MLERSKRKNRNPDPDYTARAISYISKRRTSPPPATNSRGAVVATTPTNTAAIGSGAFAPVMDDSNRVPTRPWPTDGVTKLFADATNHRDWRLCVEAVTQDQRAEKLLTRAPLDTDQVEVAQAALLKSFMMLTVHGSFRQAISPMTALEAYAHLCGLAPQTSIHEVAHSAKVKNLDSYPTPAAYVAAHRGRHDQLLSADASHYLASPSAYIADLLGGLSNTPNAHALTELYAYLPDIQKNDTTASRLTAAILRLPTSSKGNRNTRNSGTPADRQRYGRRPGDPTVTNYSCMLHKMDNHKQNDNRCRAMQTRRGSLPKPSASAVTMDPEFIHAVAGSRAAMMKASNDQNDNVNNDSQHMISPLLDSAATHHLTASVGKLRHPRPLHVSVQLANHERATTTSVESSSIMGSHSPLPLSGALCVPGLSRDLVSAGRLSNDFDITLKRDRFYVTEPSPGVPKDVVATGTRRNNVFMLDGPVTRCRSERFSKGRSSGVVLRSLQRLHDTFAHAHPDALRRLIAEKPHLKNLLLKCKGNYTCTPCNSAKLTRAPHRSVMRENCRPLHKLSSDTAGPLTQTTRGNRYFTVLADQATEYPMALPTRTKGAAGESLFEAVCQLQRASGYKVQRLHSDGAGELSEGTPKAYAKAEGITLTKSIPNTPQMNGQSERAIRTLKSCIRTQLISSGMLNSMWDYALGDCVAKLNAITRRGSVCSPHHKLFGSPPRFPLRAPFGAKGFVPNKARKPSSLSMRSIKCRYLAPLSDAVVAVRDEKSRKIIEARGADFVQIKPREPNQPPSESLAPPSLEGHD